MYRLLYHKTRDNLESSEGPLYRDSDRRLLLLDGHRAMLGRFESSDACFSPDFLSICKFEV